MVDNQNIQSMLIESELIFDIDLGIISYIRKNLADDNFFDIDILSLTYTNIMGLLQERTVKNPLNIIKKEGIEDSIIDDIYKQIKEQKINEVFNDYTISTAIFDLIINCHAAEFQSKITIVCNKYEPVDSIKEVFTDNGMDFEIIIKDDEKENEIDTTNYNAIYLKYMDNILDYRNVMGKSIYICDILTNLDPLMYDHGERVPKMEYFFEMSEFNEFRVFSMYEYKEDNYPVG